MSTCFADTFFFIALLFERDEAHAKAQTVAAQVSGRIYTSRHNRALHPRPQAIGDSP